VTADARDTSGSRAAIETRALARSFDGRPAVESLDLTVLEGEMFCLVGPDGSGKSTTIRLLAGILDPTGGDGTVLGHSLTRSPQEVRTRVGYLSQAFTLYGDLTVDENIEFFATLHGVRGYEKRREELLDFTRLTPARHRLAANLSGGMKKKLALACTLVHTPAIILLDEPSTGVDPVSRGEFWNILSGVLEEGVTVVLTTPYLDEAERCDRVGLLFRGRLMTVGPPDDIRRSMPGAVFTIDCTDPRGAYATLRTRWSSANVVLAGTRLRFWSPGGRAEAVQAVALLEKGGHSPCKLADDTPSLEDAFVALLQEAQSGERSDTAPPLRSDAAGATRAGGGAR
jgi:ABC-2 type transport system ATP-binding protein